jgi:hypothetical protein
MHSRLFNWICYGERKAERKLVHWQKLEITPTPLNKTVYMEKKIKTAEYRIKIVDEEYNRLVKVLDKNNFSYWLSLSTPVSEVPTDLRKYIDGKFKYDSIGQYVWIVDKTGGHQKFADLRGWGAIQNLFKKKNGEIDLKAAEEFQDKVGEWLVSVLNNSLSSKLSEGNTNK